MRRMVIAVLGLFLLGCNIGGEPGPYHNKTQARFINRARFSLSEDDFQTLMEQRWKMAQQSVATDAQYNLDGSKLTDPDPRALTIEPNNVTVKSEADIPAVIINATPNCKYCPYKDPTGFIKCPNPGQGYCNAWMDNLCTVVVPDGHPEYVGPYEFSNCVLAILGKDVRGR